MPLVNFSNLDFDEIKESIKDYLRANSNFTDYDFEGSNLSTIIDTLAYNTYITSYNTNMVTNEVFIDSATLRENVVSLARNVGYVPKSRRSASATVSFVVDATGISASALSLKAGLVAITNNIKQERYTFCIPEDITVPIRPSGYAHFDNIKIYQGTYIQQTYTVSSRDPFQKYILPNPGIDTSLLSVTVFEAESSSVSRKYKQYNSLFEVDDRSAIYFLQEIEGERYELLFGDGVFGTKLQEPNFIRINYIISDGDKSNNVTNFRFAGRLVDNNGNTVTGGVSLITTDSPSSGGHDIESVESIKKFAGATYSSQNRAVTAADYETLIPQIYTETQSVSAYGGEELTPPSYGKVFISIKPENGEFLSTSVKENLKIELRKYAVAGILPEIVDLKYLYVEADSNIYYNTNLTSSAAAVMSLVSKNVNVYANSTELNKFGARFKYSKYLKTIDDSDSAITSNITNVNIRRDMVPVINSFTEYEICFGNRFYLKNHGHGALMDGTLIGYNIRSSGFKVSGISDTVYLGDTPTGDLTKGSVFLFKLRSPTEPIIVKKNIGYIDYLKGEIRLNPINILSTEITSGSVPVIEISACPYSNDVIGLQDLYLQLDMRNTTFNMINDRISSGNDVSGTNYIVSTSYGYRSLIRGVPSINVNEEQVQQFTVSNRGVRTVVNTSNNTGTVVPEVIPSDQATSISSGTPSTPSVPSMPSSQSTSSGSSYSY